MKQIYMLITASILVGGCSKEYQIFRKEDKLTGAWEFEKAFYKRDGAIFRDDVTSDFNNDVIEFHPDYSAVYDDYSVKALFDGWWDIKVDDDHYYNADGGSSELEFFLDICFDDYIHREEFCYFGSITRLTREKLHYKAHDRRGVFTFKLRRL